MKHARRQVTIVHKANILKFSQGLSSTSAPDREGIRRTRRVEEKIVDRWR